MLFCLKISNFSANFLIFQNLTHLLDQFIPCRRSNFSRKDTFYLFRKMGHFNWLILIFFRASAYHEAIPKTKRLIKKGE